METHLTFDNKDRQLNLAFKERFVTDSNFVLKVTGGVNTQTGKHTFAPCELRQSCQNSPSMLHLFSPQSSRHWLTSLVHEALMHCYLQAMLSIRASLASSSMPDHVPAVDMRWQQTKNSCELEQVTF